MITLLAAICMSGGTAPVADFVVSPTGNDAGRGTHRSPFKTVERARDAVRSFRKLHPRLDRPVVVWLQKGRYELDRPLRLTSEDSGTEASPTVFTGDHAVLSGGREIRDWHVDEKGWWKTELPEVRDAGWRFVQLFVDGKRRFRPRLPKQGYYTISEQVPPTEASKGHGSDRFGFRPGDVDPSWHALSDVEVLCFHIWDMSRMRIGSIDTSSHILTTTGPTGYDAGWADFTKGNRYLVENVKEALGDPGQWYLDTRSGELTYIPLPGEKLHSCSIIAPRINRLVEIEGDPVNRHFVDHVVFRDLTFAETNWTLDPKGRFYPQAEVDLGATIHANGWRDGGLYECEICRTGEYGIEFQSGCRNVTVDRCKLLDLGAGGVKIGETKLYDDDQLPAQGITVSNSEIGHGGRLHPAAIGVWIGQSSSNKIVNNHIFDLYYTGVSIGWTWGYGKSQAHDNIIANNEINDIGQGVLSDMGGIYTLGIQPGTKLTGNRIHDIDSFSYGGWGIYPDEGSSHELIENNLVYRTKSGGFHQHYGEANTVRNNIFAFAREAEIIRTRAEDHLSFTFEHNIVYWKDAPLLGSNWSGNNFRLDNNLYWRTDGKPIDFAGMTLAAWQAKGNDVHSVIADPLFVAPERGDFHLRLHSPAELIAFKSLTVPAASERSKRADWPPPAFPTSHFF
ncbi:MAG: right-handed parallel beta-helix repeat-containing protein [Fimbriimonas sp.]|nr:right-handed parallel beta-helix repeat-containing protein [Fimbriimonas sp.]